MVFFLPPGAGRGFLVDSFFPRKDLNQLGKHSQWLEEGRDGEQEGKEGTGR